MKQYLDLLKTIQYSGTNKPAARENMPGTQSLFGYQFRHSLEEGFPLLTTKKLGWKGVIVELLWFLRGDVNIKFLEENNVRYMWHQDSYNFYVKIASANTGIEANDIYRKNNDGTLSMFTYEEYLQIIKETHRDNLPVYYYGDIKYTLGDCGYQYGKVWRSWKGESWIEGNTDGTDGCYLQNDTVDQIRNVINSLKKSPEGRRHIVSAIDPVHDTDLALYWCHAMMQFNCRPLSHLERMIIGVKMGLYTLGDRLNGDGSVMFKDGVLLFSKESDIEYRESGCKGTDEFNTLKGIPKYFLDCQMYQRSADTVLGVPFNLASYALLTEIFAKLCNMIPGDFIHTFGDVHIYDNHKEAVKEQLTREPKELPKLTINDEFWNPENSVYNDITDLSSQQLTDFFSSLRIEDFQLEGYKPYPKIEAELSTGLKK